VPVDREQHGAEHDAVISVELPADGGDQLLAGACRVGHVSDVRSRDTAM
jgi:hypothetical protein